MQNDEIARLQLENGVLQEKFTNEKRKVSLLEVVSFLSLTAIRFDCLNRISKVKCKV